MLLQIGNNRASFYRKNPHFSTFTIVNIYQIDLLCVLLLKV